MVDIRPARTFEDYHAVEHLQKVVWGMADARITPDNLLIIMHKSGGLVLLACAPQPVGFLFGFVGLTDDGRIKHCSHQAGILPEYQHQGIGYRLKLAQRAHVLAQGLQLITWTYDPLESRNAYFNLRKLGGICRTYLPNAYGFMRDTINAGLPSDRFLMEWHLASERVTSRLPTPPTPAVQPAYEPQHLEELLINPAGPGDLPRPAEHPRLPIPPRGSAGRPVRLFIQIPFDFQAIKQADSGLALAWREHLRTLCLDAFAAGYTATDMLIHHHQSYYVLERDDED